LRPTLIALLLLFSAPAFAVETRGPSLLVEGTSDGGHRQITEELKLLIPVPGSRAGGRIVGRVDGLRDRSADAGTAAVGGFYVGDQNNDHPERPGLIAGAARYSTWRLTDKGRPMAEYIAGLQTRGTHLPFIGNPADGYKTHTILAVRYRRFPGRDTWLALAGLSVLSPGGLQWEVHLPSHLQIGQHFAGGHQYVYAELRARPRVFTSRTESGAYWLDGYLLQQAAGYRRRIQGALFASLEAGRQQFNYRLYNSRGDIETERTGPYKPWIKVALETFIGGSSSATADSGASETP
jgi:hypothetical protein